jgi:UDP-2,3-diacylglucosamine pyrophosphatase LpxH
MKYKAIWISDIHLGSNSCKANEICSFLKENDCEELYLVGDIIDGWKLQRGWSWNQAHSNVIRRFLTKAKRGTTIVYIVGNHDEFLRKWLKHKFDVGNISLVNNYEYTDIKGRKWLITHGDLFDQVTRHWKWISIVGDIGYNLLLSSNGILHFIRTKFGLGYWSLSKYIKTRTKQAVNFIYKFEEHLVKHTKEGGYHGVICGHIHTPTIKTLNNITYMNTGDWVETCSAIVETYDGEFHLLILENDKMEVVKVY